MHKAQTSFDTNSKRVCGFLPERYERLDHGGVLGTVFEVCVFFAHIHEHGSIFPAA
jgi:hypothetical protein